MVTPWKRQCYLLRRMDSLSAVTHVPFHASVLRPASQVGPMHKDAWISTWTACFYFR